MHIHTHESHTLKRVYTHTRSVHWCSYGPRVCVSVVECTTATTTVKMAKFQRIGKRCWYGTGLFVCGFVRTYMRCIYIFVFNNCVFSRGTPHFPCGGRLLRFCAVDIFAMGLYAPGFYMLTSFIVPALCMCMCARNAFAIYATRSFDLHSN